MSHPSPSHDKSNEYPEDGVSHYPKKDMKSGTGGLSKGTRKMLSIDEMIGHLSKKTGYSHKMHKDAKSAALKAKTSNRFSHHDIRTNRHEEVPYSVVRSVLKNSYSKKSSGTVRQMAQKLKPNTSEAIPAKGGYYSRI